MIGNSATASKLQTARNISLSGAVSGNVNFDGSNNVEIETEQSNIAILSGTIETPPKDSESLTGDVEIDYPNGFTKDNCIIVSLMLHGSFTKSKDYWTLSTLGNDALTILLGNNGSATLKPEKIRIFANKLAANIESQTISYKLTLMKVS